MASERNITIIGAGLVGSLLAVLMRRRGFDVTVYEKRPDIRKENGEGDRSINLVMTSRGLNALSQAGLLDEALELSVPILGRMIHPKTGELVYQPYGNADECNFSISRSKLNHFLIDAAEKAGAKINFGYAVEIIDFENHEITFDSRSKPVHYDLLFATDGAGSRVRKILCRDYPDLFKEKTEWLEADYKELFIPAGPGGQYRIEKQALHIWPRGSHMMMALANLDGSFTVTLYMPRERIGSAANFNEIQTDQDVKALFANEFPDAIDLMPNFVNEFENHPQGRLGTVRCSKWVYGESVALLGDASHAIVPFFGQGMNSGFEDCTELMKLIDVARSLPGELDWAGILSAFEKIQKPNAHAIAEMALENWTEMRDKVGDSKFLLRKKVEAKLEKAFPDSFKSRYGMVTYTLNPYSKTREAGFIQDKILDELCDSISTPDEISLDLASKRLGSELATFQKAEGIELSTHPLVAMARRKLTQ